MKTALSIFVGLSIIGAGAVGLGRFLFRRKAEEQVALLNKTANSEEVIKHNVPNTLPAVVRNYLKRVLPKEQPGLKHVTLTQRGEIQTKKGTWSSFTATQHIFPAQSAQAGPLQAGPLQAGPGFVWIANLFPIYVRDSFLDRQGETLVSLLGLKSIGRATGPEMDMGAMQRYLGELCWSPTAFLDERLSWKELAPNVVEATLTLTGISASGVFTFDENGSGLDGSGLGGLIRQFEALRYMSQNGTYRLERWRVSVSDYQSFAGISIPTTAVATWLLPEGDFEAIRMHIMSYDAS